jgi:putative ABC transport system substrate-binding protein
MIARRTLLIVFSLVVLPPAWLSWAQAPGKVWRVGMLELQSMAMNAVNLDAFRRGMRELGYVEGKHLLIEYRSADGRPERFVELANEVARMKVDVIVTRGTPAAQAAKNATGIIPIVATAIGDPVRTGLVKSLARPGGNVTGLESFAVELGPKRVELLSETLPGIARIGVLANMSNAVVPAAWKEIETTAKTLGVETQLLDVRKPEDLGPAFDAATRQLAGALVVVIDGLTLGNRKTIVELAAKHRLPAMYAGKDFVDAGGLMSYGVSYSQLYFRAATYVDKILKGAKPADLPIEQPTKFELIINLKTAKALGLTIPQSVLGRADEIIQ